MSHLKAWVDELHVTHTSQTSVALYQLLPQITLLKISPEKRLDMLEYLRPVVQQCISGLSKEFLNQPLILPEKAQKLATIAQALQKHMTNGYLAAVIALLQDPKANKATKAQPEWLALALHRAITGLSFMLLRSYQLYLPTAPNLWRELHSLYQITEQYHLGSYSVNDATLETTSQTTLRDTYQRALLLSTASCNQLKQHEVGQIFRLLEHWSHLLRLQPVSDKEASYVVHLHTDSAACSKKRGVIPIDNDTRELNTDALLSHLREIKNGEDKPSIGLNSHLLEHLCQKWQSQSVRAFPRRSQREPLEVAVGLSDIHFQLSNQVPFKQTLRPPGSVPIKADNTLFSSKDTSAAADPWQDAFDADEHHHVRIPTFDKEGSNEKHHSIYTIQTIDMSAGGYRLEWRESIPAHVKVGELMAHREPRRNRWHIGVIRWVKQTRHATQLGLQTLSVQAIALGAAMIQKTGDRSEYMRVLLIPELKTANQPSMLVTPALPFREYAKVTLNEAGKARLVQLTQRQFSSSACQQFTFRELDDNAAKQRN